MKNKLPYDIIALEANKLIVRMTLSKNNSFYYYELYMAYIHACGWTNTQYDEETLKRIDTNWEIFSKKNIVWN
jgi:hypothetical protein